MFTIEVERKEKDEEFDPEHLKLFHKECYGGKVEARVEPVGASVLPLEYEVRVRCQRCGECVKLPYSLLQEIRGSIVKTAIDGEERKIRDTLTKAEVSVIQRKEV